jgi:hypothetical protein
VSTVYSRDIWMPALTLTSSNNKFRLLENVGVTNDERIVSVAAGTYYGHGEAALTSAGLLGLYDSLATAINAVSTNTYSFVVIDPVQSSSFTLGGIRIIATGASVDFQIDYDDADFTMDPAWFGQRLSTASDDYGSSAWGGASTDPWTSTTSGSDEVIDSDYSVSSRWYSFTHGNTTHAAADKRAHRYGNRRYSSSRLSDGISLEWDSGRERSFRYEWVPSQHVYATRGEAQNVSRVGPSAWATLADLDGDDRYQGFDEYVWEPMARLSPCLIQHNVTTPSLSNITSHPYELVRLLREDQAKDFRNVAELQRRGGEFYALNVDVQIDPSWDNVSH